MQNTLTWHGHANFQIKAGEANILIDPFFEGNPSAVKAAGEVGQPTCILITHDHGDHVGQAVELAKESGAVVGAIVGTAQKLVEAGIPQEQIMNGIGFNIGGTLDHKGCAVAMTQAFHSSDSGAPAGYIVTLPDGFTIYHAGDTGIFQSMQTWGELYNIDLALLPIGGVFTMDPRQAALACKLLGAEGAVPMHWGSFPVLEKSTKTFMSFVQEMSPDTAVVEMVPGQPMLLRRPVDTCGCD